MAKVRSIFVEVLCELVKRGNMPVTTPRGNTRYLSDLARMGLAYKLGAHTRLGPYIPTRLAKELVAHASPEEIRQVFVGEFHRVGAQGWPTDGQKIRIPDHLRRRWAPDDDDDPEDDLPPEPGEPALFRPPPPPVKTDPEECSCRGYLVQVLDALQVPQGELPFRVGYALGKVTP